MTGVLIATHDCIAITHMPLKGGGGDLSNGSVGCYNDYIPAHSGCVSI